MTEPDHTCHHRHDSAAEGRVDAQDGTVHDPVCGMMVDPVASTHHVIHGGHNYHFCSAGCRTKFLADPQKYLTPAEPFQPPVGTIWICLMHPQVRQDRPGPCPICGMALEPELAIPDTGPGRNISTCAVGCFWPPCWPCRCSCWKWEGMSCQPCII